MTISQTSFLAEVAAGHSGSSIPAAKRAYFQQRLRNRIFNFLLEKFLSGQETGLTKAILSRRIEKTPDVINRWLGAPSNLTLDTVSDLLLGIAAEEFEPNSSSPLAQVQSNYSHFEELISASDLVEKANSRLGKQSAEDIRAQPQTPLDTGHSALAASMLNYDQGTKIIKQHLGER